MANVSILCKYCSLLVVFLSLCFLPLCYSGKMRRKPKHEGGGIRRSIKILDRRYTRKVQQVTSPEEFVRLFEPKLVDEAELTDRHFLERTSLDAGVFTENNFHRRLHLEEANNETFESVMASIRAPLCGEPKPVLLDVYEAIGIGKGRLRWIWPECVEVNRCGPQSGCCPDSHTCSVVNGGVRNVSRTVLFGSVLFGDNIKDRNPDVGTYTVEVEEHTACECRVNRGCNDLRCNGLKTKDSVRCACVCPKRCPLPYITTDSCGCNCSTERTVAGRSCRKIYRGKEVMVEKECQCVRKHQCSTPICRNRYVFDNITCTCIRRPIDSERIAMTIGDIEIRSMNGSLLSNLTSQGLDGLDDIGLSPMVRAKGQLKAKGTSLALDPAMTEHPKLGYLVPESDEYQHSSHTKSYNDTSDASNKSSSTNKTPKKTKISPWNKSGDEMNATFMDENNENTMLVTPNETEHEAVANQETRGNEEGNSEVPSSILPERTGAPVTVEEGDGVNVLNTLRAMDYAEEFSNESFYIDPSTSSDYSSKFSYSSSSDDEAELVDDEDKYDYGLGEEFREENDDRDTYESSGDGMAGY